MSTDLKGKSILILDAYFEPENISFTHLEKDLIEGFINEGMTVRVICPTPTRNISDDIYQEYKHKKYEERFGGKFIIKRFWAPREGKNPLIRAFRYFWCNFRTMHLGKKEQNIDFVFSNSTPPTQGLIAGKIAKKKNVPFIYSLQDIFPDSLVTTGLTKKNSILWKIGRRIEKETYKCANQIIVISDAMKHNLIAKKVENVKISMITNWIDLAAVKPVSREDNPLFDTLGISRDSFIVVYAGNMGEAQNAISIVKVAELIDDKDILFVLFGAGKDYEYIKEYILKKSLNNIILNPLLPQSYVPYVYSLGNLSIVTCKKGVGKSGMPSKVWSIMACNIAIAALFDTNSDLNQLLVKTNAGICVEPDNLAEMANRIIDVKNGKLHFDTNIRKVAVETSSKKKCVDEYISILKRSVL